MFIYDFVAVPLGFADASQALLTEDHHLRLAAERAYESAAALASNAGVTGRGASGPARLAVGLARHRDDTLVVPIHWAGTGAVGVFAALEGDLLLAPFGPNRSHLSLSALSHDDPGLPGSRRDARVVQRATEAGVRTFLVAVGAALCELASPR